MLDIQRAVAFVEANGKTLERYRLRFLLGTQRNDEIPLKHFTNLQNRDGGFPHKDMKGLTSCVNDTNNNLHLMHELELAKSDVCRKTVEYLSKIQRDDGSWNENDSIRHYNPPIWDRPDNPNTALWLTADIANVLIQLDCKDSTAIQKAVTFLLNNRDKNGKFAGPLHSTWISVGIFGQLEQNYSSVVKEALNVIESNFEKLRDGAGDFAWSLECFYAGGIPKENLLVKRCIEELKGLQQENGSWKSADGEEYTVSTTLSALRVLKNYGVW